MERKIGEIFECKGEWYQCAESEQDACTNCAFNPINGIGYNCSGSCAYKQVIFKKLEKVGEPIIYMSRTFQRLKSPDAEQCKYCYFGSQVCNPRLCGKESFLVEIKQNKEDMEEKKLIELLSEKVHNAWMKEKEAQGFSYGKEYDKEKKKHPDMLPYNELKEEVKEYDRVTVRAVLQAQKELSADANKLSFKEFNLEAAKLGKPVCTRDGRKARIICFDAKDTQPIIGLYEKNIDGIVREYLCSYHTDGRMYDDQDTGYDLMMLPEKKEGWVNVYYDNDASSHRGCRFIYDTKEQAVKEAGSAYITTIKINWEE